ncbi:MAG: glycosyltransferase family 4 protein [Anaerolineales bacterium]
MLTLRLVIPTLDFFPNRGGQQEYLFELAQRLTAAYQVTILTPVGGPLPPASRFSRVVLPSASPIRLWQGIRALRPDILLLGHAHPRLLLAGWLWGKYGTFTFGNDFLAAQKHWHTPFFNRLLRRSRPLIAITRAMGARLQALGMSAPAIVRPGTNPARFFPSPSFPPSPTLLTLSRLVPRKGIDTVLHTLPTLRKTFPTLNYLIGGKGPDRERLETLANDLGVAQAVKFLGFIPDEEVPALYRKATIFVMPSREDLQASSVEGFGIVFLEASACGLPVVASNSGGIAEAVREGETGLLVPPDDPSALAQALYHLLTDPGRCRRMGQAGRAWVEREMNWDRAGREMLEVLQAG